MDIKECKFGELSEVIGTGDYHLERMEDNSWWLTLQNDGKECVQVNLTSEQDVIGILYKES